MMDIHNTAKTPWCGIPKEQRDAILAAEKAGGGVERYWFDLEQWGETKSTLWLDIATYRIRPGSVPEADALAEIERLKAELAAMTAERDAALVTSGRWKNMSQSNAAALNLVAEAFGQLLPGCIKAEEEMGPEAEEHAREIIAAMHVVRSALAERDTALTTRRDEFAMRALTGLAGLSANPDLRKGSAWAPCDVARRAYQIADAMKAAREVGE